MSVPNQTRRNTLILTSIVLGVAWAVVYLFLNYQISSSIEKQFQRVAASAKNLFEVNLEHDKIELELRLDKLIASKGLAKAVSSKDHESIASIVLPLYNELKLIQNSVNILTFRTNEGITLFRAHKPQYFGDKLNKNRTLMTDTNTMQRSFSGFEVGNLEMTYRITKPIFYNDVYVGNVELGISPENFLKNLNSIFEADIGVAVNSSLMNVLINKDGIAIGENYILIKGSENLKKHLEHEHNEDAELYKIDMSIPLNNHLSKTLGHLVIGFDMSGVAKKDREFMQHLFFMIVVIMLILGAIHHIGFSKMLEYFSKQVYTDHLTTLLNRHALNDNLLSLENKVLILSNIKEFSLINEIYGVDVGNEILIRVAEAFDEFAKKYNFDAYRISSDEFVLLKKEDNFEGDEYCKIIEELHNKLSSLKIFVVGVDEAISIEIYSGMAFNDKHPLEDAQMAIKKAKKQSLPYLMYSQKVDTKEYSQNVMRVKRCVKYALEHKNVIPFFQPITDRDGVVIKYEALARIVEFDGGEKKILPPCEFLDISMNSGLYIQIAKEMLVQSLSFFAKRSEKISINFLPNDFFNTSMMDTLMEQIKEFDSPRRVVVEITEQEGVENFKMLRKVVEKLREMGVQIAIDDFGSGYANYAHILEIKPDYLKIDGSLIQNILTDSDSQILVKSIIRFAQELNITTVAEFVENEKIFELLKEYGVDEFQGYYFGRPVDLCSIISPLPHQPEELLKI
ncbi:EAL domain-containing protein [Sulfurimonas crateris]|uniref:EAL domain-containing protein n=1 Tax=Sulfurimonas crateris TaxID=2574727 RepID=A0A4U2Z619_9BACT|nr:EAL domain-containing protein [Sulfurimonas crateris]TKI69667.1 EAL domain-containing protein [Sulfurimonas crateris]